MKLLLATTNPDKIKEITSLFSIISVVKLISLQDLHITDVADESGKTLEENAVIKARFYGDLAGFITIAEDSGLEVDALDGAPGVYSARFAITPFASNQKVLRLLKNISPEKRTARFRTVAAIYNPRDKTVQTFEGTTEGIISHDPIGFNGFGYDPIFYSDEIGKTFGEANLEEKNKVSHRARAIIGALSYLKNHN